MFAATAAQMRAIDKVGCEIKGGICLMENAASAMTMEILRRYGNNCHVIAVCGGGNNGGDGLCAAVQLADAGCQVQICLTGEVKTADAAVMLARAKEAGIPFTTEIEAADVVIDAIIGTGFSGTLREDITAWVQKINRSGAAVVAADCPTGVSSDDGSYFEAVRADVTVTFHRPKPGLYLYPGREMCGEIVIAEIDMPARAEHEISFSTEIAEQDSILLQLPARKKNSHKGSYGMAVVAGGSRGMCGSIALAALGALRSGAGKVIAAVPETIEPILSIKLNEAMVSTLTNAQELLKLGATAIGIGCGLGTGISQQQLVRELICSCDVPLVLDADALNCIADRPSILKEAHCPVLLTPHPGEMARLCGCSTAEIQGARLRYAQEFSKKYGAFLILKGAGSVVASPEGKILINTTGGPALAKGGSGDLLCGMVTGFAAQGLSPYKAAACAAYYHGLAGDRIAERYGDYAVLATDVAQELTAVLR